MKRVIKSYFLRSAFRHLFFFAFLFLLSLLFICVNSNRNRVSAFLITDPVEIYYLQDLDDIRLDWDGDYVLTRDLDFNDDASYDQTDADWAAKKTAWTTGTGWSPLEDLAGTFDGGGYKISNLYIRMEDDLPTGLFGVTDEFDISNIGLEGVNVTSNSYYVGGLVGEMDYTGTISNSYVTGTVTGLIDYAVAFTGGLVGRINGDVTITDSYLMGTVAGGDYVGGLVGASYGNITITNSYSMGTVTGKESVGGLIGYGWQTGIVDSYSTASVTGESLIGGLIGYGGQTEIADSYSMGTITGEDLVGGLVGYTFQEIITDSYTTGDIVGNYDVGGLSGFALYDVTITNSYSTGDIIGLYTVGGLLGYSGGNGYAMTITNSYSLGAVTADGSEVGGLVGYSNRMIINNSFSKGNISGNGEFVGGLSGYTFEGEILNSYAAGNIINNGDYVGGLVGMNMAKEIPSEFGPELISNGDFTTVPDTSWTFGSGWTHDTVNHEVDHANTCNGAILEQDIGIETGKKYQIRFTKKNSINGGGFQLRVGGNNDSEFWYIYDGNGVDITTNFTADNTGNLQFVPYSSNCQFSITNISVREITAVIYTEGIISNSYSTGAVTGVGNNVGGLVGLNDGGVITNSFWDTQTSGLSTSSGGIGKTTSEMKSIDTFNMWDITHKYDFSPSTPTIWYIDNTYDYPHLYFEFIAPTPVVIPAVRITDIGLATNVPYSDNLLYYFTSTSAQIKGITSPNTIVKFINNGNSYTAQADGTGAFDITLNFSNGNNSIQYYAYNLYEDQSPTRTLTIVVGSEYWPTAKITSIGLITDIPDRDTLLYYFTSSNARIKGITSPNASVKFITNGNTYIAQADSTGVFEITLVLPDGSNSIQYYANSLYEGQPPARTLTLVVGTEYFPEDLLIQLGLMDSTPVENPEEEVKNETISEPEEETDDTEVESQVLQFLDSEGQPMINALVVVENTEYYTDSNGEIKVSGLEKEKTYKIVIEKNGIKYETEVLGIGDSEEESKIVVDVSKETVSKSIDWKNILIYGGIGLLVVGFTVVSIAKRKR